MLPRKHRLSDDYDFNRVKRVGKTYRTPLFNLTVAKSKDPKLPSRFGFVVSTKIDKRATRRNRVKRILREGVRKNLPSTALGFDAVFVARKEIKGAPYEEISLEVDKVLSKASLLSR